MSYVPTGSQPTKSTTDENGTAPVPVQQIFNGPSCSYITVFNTPGSYDININFRPEGVMNPVGQTGFGNANPSQPSKHATNLRQIKSPSAYPTGTQSGSQWQKK